MTELRFEVHEATERKFSAKTYFQNMFRPARAFESYTSGMRPSVRATNGRGDVCIVKVVKTIEEARNEAVVIERDYSTLSGADWCEKYSIPPSFISE